MVTQLSHKLMEAVLEDLDLAWRTEDTYRRIHMYLSTAWSPCTTYLVTLYNVSVHPVPVWTPCTTNLDTLYNESGHPVQQIWTPCT